MQELKMKIQQEGSVLTSQILKVDSFLNHQLDSELLVQMGEVFATHFKDKKITKVMTVETSGIAIALTTAIALKVPVVFGRKQQSVVTDKEVYSAPVFSFTKRTMSRITVSKKLLHQDDHVLIIDDFLAHGETTLGLVAIAKQANASVVGVGVVIEKSFQDGRNKLQAAGLDVYALARVKKLIPPDQVEFEESI